MIFKRRTKRYLILTPTEASLALRALLHFRNKALARSIDPVDINIFIKKLHHILTYGTYADRKENLRPGEFRLSKSKIGVPHKEIIPALSALLKEYEKGAVDMERILDFHVRFEQIRPFEDYNGRVGRLIMMKECLRHGVDPFIIDDKRRNQYYKGIACWDTDSDVLRMVCREAQTRFQGQMELCRLMQYCRMPNY